MPSLKNKFKPGDFYFVLKSCGFSMNTTGFRILIEINKRDGYLKALYIRPKSFVEYTVDIAILENAIEDGNIDYYEL